MKCTDLHKDLIFYLDDELTPERKAAVNHHLKGCSKCAAFLKELEASWRIIEREKNVDTNPFLLTRIEARLQEQKHATTAKGWVLVPQRIAQPVFFSLLLVVAIYGGIKLGESPVNVGQDEKIENQLYLDDFNSEPIESFLTQQS